MDFRVLGSLEVVSDDGQPLALGGPKQRALLATLLLAANAPVGRSRLIEALWGEHPPASADESLDTYVYRLRKLLGADRLARRPGGYSLALEPGELDLERFELLVADAGTASAAGHPAIAARTLRRALELWRGRALADLVHEAFEIAEVDRLEARWLFASEQAIEAELALGNGPELVPELEALARAHPLRERLVYQLMLALYRSGRQAEALAAYQAARRRLSNQLGLAPGPELRALERRILQHDPELPRRGARDGIGLTARRRVPRLAVGLALAGASVLALVLALVLSATTPSTSVAATRLDGLYALDAATGRPARAVALPTRPSALLAAAGAVWIADATGGTVSRVETGSGAVTDRIDVGGTPGSLTAGDGAVWVASTLGGTLDRIDPATDRVVLRIRLGNARPVALAASRHSVWVADANDRALLELDPGSGSVRRTFTLGIRPTALATVGGTLWIASYDAGVVERFDPVAGKTTDVLQVGEGPAAVAARDGALWVANSLDGTVSRVDTQRGRVVATIVVGSEPTALSATRNAIWVANQSSGTLSRIDPQRNAVVATTAAGGRPAALAADGNRVWVGVAAPGALHRGGTLRLRTTTHFATVDPALYDSANGFLFMRLAHDTLVTLEPASGPEGLRLVPDLALQLPVTTAGGTVYTFRLRPGIHYSDGRLVRAGDFRRAIERLFRLSSPGATYYTGVSGAASCRSRRAHCDLSSGVVTDDAAGTVIFHLTAPDPAFLLKLTPYAFGAPVPEGTPDHDVGLVPVPGTGPYRIARAGTQGIRFARNPYFREWSRAAQPAGNPDAIVWSYSPSHPATVRAIERGTADWTLDLIPPAQLRALQTRFPAQLHTSASQIVEFAPINTHAPPFDDVRVRRALNYAIDRGKIASWYGGPTVATPTCQPLTPRLPGFERFCPYTLHPRADGIWSAPDLPRARRLVDASGTRGVRVDVWGTTDEIAIPAQVPRYFARVLRALGYRVRLHLAPYATITPARRRSFQLSVDGDWLPDYASPSSYLPQFFSCDGGNSNGYSCTPELDVAMHEANSLADSDPARAASLWTGIDHTLTDQAAWVPTVDLNAVELVSRRLRNYQYNPIWGFVPDQVWLR